MSNRIFLLGLHLGQFFALAFGFEHYIVPIFGHEGFFWTPDETKFFSALAIVVTLSFITPAKSLKPGTLFFQLAMIFVLIPMVMLFYAENKPWEFMLQICAAYLACLVFYQFVNVKAPQIASISKDQLRLNLFIISVMYIAIVFALGGGRYLNFDLSKVYDLRDAASDNLPGVFGYITPLIGKVIIPVAFVLALLYKKYAMAGILMCLSILVFGLTANKAPLFYPFFIFLVYIFASGKNLVLKFNIAILVLLVICIGDFWMAEKYSNDVFGWVGSLLMRRLFIVPSEINFMYYDFFSRNELVLFSNSKLSLGLIDYPYPIDVSHMIGLKYMGGIETSANTGWFGSGYMQAGFFGLVLYAFLIALIFKYVDACARFSGDHALVTATTVLPVLAVISATDLPAALLTHGLFINLLLIAFFNRKESSHAFSAPKQRSPA